MARYEIRLSGSGGQGMILAGIIMAEAALDEDGLNVTQTQSYGPESRGGASRAEVILSREAVNYPKVVQPDILVALTQEAFDKYSLDVKEGGFIIVDEKIDISTAEQRKKSRILSLPILKTAEEEAGVKLTANIVTLGIISGLYPEIRRESLEKAISKRVPPHMVDVNLKAFKLGEELIKKLVN